MLYVAKHSATTKGRQRQIFAKGFELAIKDATCLFRHEVQVGVREVFIRDPPLNGTEQVLKRRGPPHLSLDETVTLLHTLC